MRNVFSGVSMRSANSLKNAQLYRAVKREAAQAQTTGEKLRRVLDGTPDVIVATDNERILGLLAKIGISGEIAVPFLLEPLPGDDDATRH